VVEPYLPNKFIWWREKNGRINRYYIW
jgi:hypothetical protein